jgi:glycosyltransferase involved in cell wall biosynthesis
VEPNTALSLDDLPAPPSGRCGWPWTVATPAPEDEAGIPWPRISIVTPSYQQGAFIEECMRSVLLQGYPNLEYLVMDGASRDGSPEIIARYAGRLAHWQSSADSGQGDAINRGFERASGEILGWLNSDDLLLPGALIAVARAFLRGKPDIVYGDALNAFEDDRTLQYWQGYWVTPSFLQFGGIISSHAVFWRRSAHVPLWSELNCNVDGELWQRLVPGRRLKYLPQPLGVYRTHGDTKSSSAQWAEKWRRDDEMIWARHGRPTSSRVFRQWFKRSQAVFKWINWRRNRAARRSVIDACQWADRGWRGPRP